MTIGPQELILLLFLLALFAFPLWGIIDAAVRPDSQWRAANQNKIVWVLLQIFLGIIGAIVYFAAIRPKLKAVPASRLQ